MKVTTSKPVYERNSAPSTAALAEFHLPAGRDYEVDGWILGESIESNNVWYVKNRSKFYWSGGFGAQPDVAEIVKDGARAFHETIQKAWQTTRGANAIITIIDSGVDLDNPELKSKTILELSRGFRGDTTDFKDNSGHGTRMAGLMVSLSSGLAPEAKLIAYKVFDGGSESMMERLVPALQAAKNSPAGVINLSLELPDALARKFPALCKDIQKAANDCLAKRKIILAASGNHGLIGFPGTLDGVITVGSIDQGLDLLTFSDGLPEKSPLKTIDVFVEGYVREKLLLNGGVTDEINHSSDATASLSALVALKKSMNSGYDQQQLRNDIARCAATRVSLKNLDVKVLDISSFLNFQL